MKPTVYRREKEAGIKDDPVVLKSIQKGKGGGELIWGREEPGRAV